MKLRTFKNPHVLHEMLFLRLQGWPLQNLAYRYGCNKTSVRKVCIRYGIPNHVVLLPSPTITFHRVLTDFNGERINRGKNYADYLKEQKRRQLYKQSR